MSDRSQILANLKKIFYGTRSQLAEHYKAAPEELKQRADYYLSESVDPEMAFWRSIDNEAMLYTMAFAIETVAQSTGSSLTEITRLVTGSKDLPSAP